jgi:hypothetical protein
MPVIVTKQIKKKRILIAAFAVLIIATLAILYFGGVIGGGSLPISVGLPVSDSSITGDGQEIKVPISDAKLKILEDERFTNLQNSPGVPISTETTGKSNPFSD